MNAHLDNHARPHETCGLSVWCKCRQPLRCVCVCVCVASAALAMSLSKHSCAAGLPAVCWKVVQAGVFRPQPHCWAPVMARVSTSTFQRNDHGWVYGPLLQGLPQVTHPPQPFSPEPWMCCCAPSPPSVRPGPPCGRRALQGCGRPPQLAGLALAAFP